MCCFIVDLKTGMLIIAIITIIVAVGGLLDTMNILFFYGGGDVNGDPTYGIVSCVFLIP